MEENPVMRALITEALKQNEAVFNDPNTPENVKRVLNVQALTIKALDAQLNASTEKLAYIVSQLMK